MVICFRKRFLVSLLSQHFHQKIKQQTTQAVENCHSHSSVIWLIMSKFRILKASLWLIYRKIVEFIIYTFIFEFWKIKIKECSVHLYSGPCIRSNVEKIWILSRNVHLLSFAKANIYTFLEVIQISKKNYKSHLQMDIFSPIDLLPR